jgi:hypothetical protein
MSIRRRPRHLGLNYAAIGGPPASYAMQQLSLRGGVGIFASYEFDSVAIVDPVTPANNYDGPFIGKFTIAGGAVAGPNGGLLAVGSSDYARLATTAFGWDPTQGTLGAEFIRTAAAVSFAQYTAINTVVLRNGATIATVRGEIAGIGNRDSLDPRLYADVRTMGATTWSTLASGCTTNGYLTPLGAGGTCTASAGNFDLGGSGVGEYAEIFNAWYIPTPMTALQLQAVTQLTDPAGHYVNSVTGDDADDGLSDGEAKLTIAGVLAAGAKVRTGDSIYLQGRFHTTEVSFPPFVPTASYGDDQAILDGSVAIVGANWTVNGTHATVYDYTATQTVGTQPFYPSLWWGDYGEGEDPEDCRATSASSVAIATGSKSFTVEAGKAFAVDQTVRIWQSSNRANFMFGLVTAYSGTTLTVNVVDTGGSGTIASWVINLTSSLNGYWSGANLAANIAFVAAHKGRFTTDIVAGPDTEVTYYLNPPDGLDPGVGLIPIYWGEHKTLIVLTGGQELSTFTVQRTATKDMINKNNSNDIDVTTSGMRLLDAAAHGIVCSPAHHTDGYARGQDSSIPGAGGLWHFFHDTALTTSSDCSAVNCVAQNGGLGFYSHGTGGIPNDSVAISGCEMVDCATPSQNGGNFEGVGLWTYTNCVRTNSGAYVQIGADDDIFINSP